MLGGLCLEVPDHRKSCCLDAWFHCLGNQFVIKYMHFLRKESFSLLHFSNENQNIKNRYEEMGWAKSEYPFGLITMVLTFVWKVTFSYNCRWDETLRQQEVK